MITRLIKVAAVIKAKLIMITFTKKPLIAKSKTKVIIFAIIILLNVNKELTPLLNKINVNIIYKNKLEIVV